MDGRSQRDLIAGVLAAHRAGDLSAEVALMRLVLGGVPAAAVPAAVAAHPALAALAARQATGLARLESLRDLGAAHAPGTGLAATRAMFDRLVAANPEAAVAAYSFGDPGTLDRATAELVAWLRGLGLLARRPRVLDLGCGIGRVGAAIAAEAGCVLGLDISPAMVEAARARHAGRPGLRFEVADGTSLAGVADRAIDLILAVDVFPYLAQAGAVGDMLAEAARCLRPGGQIVILNLDYAARDGGLAALAAIAPRHGLQLAEAGTRPFALWDATAFRLVAAGLDAPDPP